MTTKRRDRRKPILQVRAAFWLGWTLAGSTRRGVVGCEELSDLFYIIQNA